MSGHHNIPKQQRGFALMDVLLAVILIATIATASYEMISSYRNKANVQTVESDIINIAQTYAPIQNQTAIEMSGYDIFSSKSSAIAKSFLESVPIPSSRMSSPTIEDDVSYVYLTTNLLSSSGQSRVGFESSTVSGSGSDATFKYFLIGLQVNYDQAVQIIQDMNDTFSIFVGSSSDNIQSSKAATSLPQCDDKNCMLNLYLVTPTLNNASSLKQSFLAPSPIK